MSAYHTLIRMIADGMAVNAAAANAPLAQLQGNIDYLKELLEAALTGSTVFARDRTVDADVRVGQAVYYNGTTQQFEKAQAGVTTDSQGELVTTSATHVWGLVYRKLNATKADVLLHGLAELSLADAVDGDVEAGLYYLSLSAPGMLTRQQQPVPVPVCLVAGPGETAGTYEVYVNSDFRDALDAHRHYRVELVCQQAADESEEGWLAADHAAFADNAPVGAVYGYNLAASSLAGLWPPIPVSNAYLEWHRGEDKWLMGMGVPAGSDPGNLVVFDTNGIWWLSDCDGDVPWVAEDSLSGAVGCPRQPYMRMILWFTRPVFWTSNTAVLSMRARAGSGLVITCAGTDDEAATGHLEIDLDLDLLSDETDQAGHLVFKSLADNQFQRGPVVEGIKAGTSNVALATPLGIPDDGVYQGVVTISVDSELGGTEFPVRTIRLDGVTEEFHEEVIALGFPAAISSEFRGQVCVPAKTALPAGTQMKLRFRLLGRAAGAIPGDLFTLTYRRIPKPSAMLTAASLPLVDTAITLDTGITLTAADQYFDVESGAFDVLAGDIVLFTLARGATDGYAAEVHVLQEHGVLA